ncbi:NADP-dependent oxidoreductase [Microbacterium immunditiarum]|uniref:NADPH:quinone reductase-like Zn-dependent oxidoreductase n=1 Tax=Microbacterium immunditiarum TaxID=337480 RepID=A0A7Y9GM17_9MICO|nr:NADP-dependent oxidoreductase [Microbacterium immunditiarum]NYE18990.1 NADPH:quinone reductase-like Zn-dependent oxidoreductase [Microbacterium immunditiarum]
MNENSNDVMAVGLADYGGPEVLQVVRLRPESLEPGHVRLRVLAAAVNPTDVVVRTGGRAQSDRPITIDVPGMDAAGVVTEIAPDVTSVAVGDRVIALVIPSGEHGAYRTDVVVPEATVTAAPRGLTHAEAATLPLNGMTGWLALRALALNAGDVLAVTGAAGALGGYVVQLAKHAGLTVVADASAEDRALVSRLGADVVVPRGPGFAAAVREVYPDGVAGLVDASVQGAEVLPAVRDGGAVVTVRGYRGDGTDRVRVTPIISIEAIGSGALDEIRQLAEERVLDPRVADVVPASEAQQAHRRLQAGGLRGRIVLDLS